MDFISCMDDLCFDDVVDDSSLDDIGYSGHTYTWSNNRKSDNIILYRHDKILTNEE